MSDGVVRSFPSKGRGVGRTEEEEGEGEGTETKEVVDSFLPCALSQWVLPPTVQGESVWNPPPFNPRPEDGGRGLNPYISHPVTHSSLPRSVST